MRIKLYNTIDPVEYKKIDKGKQEFNCLNVKQTLHQLNIGHAYESVYAKLTRINNPHHLINDYNHNPLTLNDADSIHHALHKIPSEQRTNLENLLYKEACYIKDIHRISDDNISQIITDLKDSHFHQPQITDNRTLKLISGNIHVSIEHNHLYGRHSIRIDNSQNPPETSGKVFAGLYNRIKQLLPEDRAEINKEYQSGPYLVINIKSRSKFKSIFYS
ncbi:MAG: hypothetical protein ABIH39_08600 [Candidatus Margulisiibacteriota bacterium]